KSLTEFGDKIEAGEKEKIEAAIKELEEAMKGDDKDEIEAKTKALTEASGKMVEKLYAQNQQGAGEAGAEDAGAEQGAAGDDVVDAEFEEVDDNKK
ncbi:MAG TPA: Hsp70 family protein, partial [Gammaproteobacteria bacterium]